MRSSFILFIIYVNLLYFHFCRIFQLQTFWIKPVLTSPMALRYVLGFSTHIDDLKFITDDQIALNVYQPVIPGYYS